MVVDRLSHTDEIGLFGWMQYSSARNQQPLWITSVSGNWGHRFDLHTSSLLGVGFSGTRTPLHGEIVAYSIYPIFNAALVNVTKLARGTLNSGLFATSMPVVDLTTG